MDDIMITVDFLKELIDNRKITEIKEIFQEYNIVDLAQETQKLETADVLFLFRILPKDITGQIFSYFEAEYQEIMIEACSDREIQNMVSGMYSDDMVDIVEDLPANLVQKVLHNVPKEQREQINQLLSYPESSAGSIMSIEYVELKETDTIAQAIQKIKSKGKAAETINVCFVTNFVKRLVGTIQPEDILFERSNDVIYNHMDTHVIYCHTTDDQEDVSEQFAKYDISVLPVVNNDHCLIGIITVDDIIDVVEDEVTEDIQKMAMIQPLDHSYLDTEIFSMFKSRIPWLMILMLSATFTGMILQNYEDKLQVIPVLTAFIPMIMGSSGNAGNQSAVTIIRGMAINEITMKDFFKVAWKESRIALICASALFVVSMLRIILFPPVVNLYIAFVVSFALFVSVFLGKLLGASLPFISLALHLDPATMTTPLLSTIADVLSLIVYFILCVTFLKI